MTTFAYCRVSTSDQSTVIQQEAILKSYPDAIIREEKASATSKAERGVLNLLLDMVSTGDKLVVWKLDRLARNMTDLLQIVETLKHKGAALEVLDQRIDTSTASGKAFLQMLGVFAEFETNLRKERQLAGIERTKRESPEVYQGRKPSIEGRQIKDLLNAGMKPVDVAKKLGISRASVYRYKS